VLRELERRVLLSVLDRKWREHLYEVDYLQEGIGLRAMAQRDPLVEYQREGFDMFAAMMDAVKEESVGFLFNLEVQVDEDAGVTAAPAPAGPSFEKQTQPAVPAEDGVPQLDLALLEAAQQEHETHGNGKPRINAKGLDRSAEEKPLIYSAPELGSDTPAVQTSGGSGGDKPAGQSATARRQQARQNPNRGSRGNKGKRKR
jgi:preprotein translocase subunit SecA